MDSDHDIKQWPFVETPGEFAKRLHAAAIEFGDMVAAVRHVLIENPPTMRAAPEPAQAVPLTDEQIDPFKGWPLDRVEVGDMGTAQIGGSYDDGEFAPVVTVDTGLYYQPQLAGPLANAIAAAIKHARAHGIKQPGSDET